MIKEKRLSPIIKWAGGKEQELKHIHPCLPEKIKNYYEPFIGGGAVYFSLDAEKMFINDKSSELIGLYNAVTSENEAFYIYVKNFDRIWNHFEHIIEKNKNIIVADYDSYRQNFIDIENIANACLLRICESGLIGDKIADEIYISLLNKLKRMKKIEGEKNTLSDSDILDNIESAFKSGYYMYIRHLYNNIKKYEISDSFATAIFFFIRNYAYSGMFRYNKSGGFNVPYGGIGYNRKNLSKKVDYLKSDELTKHLSKTTIDNLDFEEFFKKNKPEKDDFIFLDPPYDSEFSTYAQNEFTRQDQTRLADYLIKDCKANWMMVIKHTDFIYDLYNKPNIKISAYDKKYLVNFQNRNDKDVQHLLITNY
jgi:DNA adenine methylase